MAEGIPEEAKNEAQMYAIRKANMKIRGFAPMDDPFSEFAVSAVVTFDHTQGEQENKESDEKVQNLSTSHSASQ